MFRNLGHKNSNAEQFRTILTARSSGHLTGNASQRVPRTGIAARNLYSFGSGYRVPRLAQERRERGIPLIELGVIIGAIGCSGATDSQDEVVSKAGAALINQLPARNK